MAVWFLTAGPLVGIPIIFAEFSEWKNCRCLQEASPSRIGPILWQFPWPRRWPSSPSSDSSTSSWSPIRQSQGLSCWSYAYLLRNLPKTLFPPVLWWMRPAQHNPLIGRRIECSFVLLFELVNVSGKVPCLALGASLLSFSLFLRSVLKFHSEGTSLMRIFDLYLSKRWSFLFSDTRLTWRRLSELCSSNWSQHFFHRVSPRLCVSLRFQWFWVLRDTTQLWYNFHTNCSTFVFAFPFLELKLLLGFLFGCSSTLWCGNRHLSPASQPDSALQNWHSRGCQYSQSNLVQVPFKKYLHGCRRVTLFFFFFSTRFYFGSLMAQRVERLSVSVLVPPHLATHHSVIRRHVFLDFRFLLIHATILLVLMSPRSPFHFFLLLEFQCLSQFPAMKV